MFDYMAFCVLENIDLIVYSWRPHTTQLTCISDPILFEIHQDFCKI